MCASRWSSATGRPSVSFEPGAGEPLHDAAGDAVVAADRHRRASRRGDLREERGDALDAALVVVRLRERDVAEVVDPARLPGGEAERGVVAALERRDVADGARSEVLVALRRARCPEACGTPTSATSQLAGIGIDRAAEERRGAPPVEALDHHAVAGLELVEAHSRADGSPARARATLRAVVSPLSMAPSMNPFQPSATSAVAR